MLTFLLFFFILCPLCDVFSIFLFLKRFKHNNVRFYINPPSLILKLCNCKTLTQNEDEEFDRFAEKNQNDFYLNKLLHLQLHCML